MSQLSQNLERLIQMISIEQLLGLVKQNNTDNKTNSDILTTPIVQKVVKAYEDELQTLNSVTNPNACVKDYSEDIAKIHEQLASINNNLLHLADAIKNIHIRTNVVKSSSEAANEVVASLEEEHVRLKIEEKQVTTTNELDDSDEVEEESVASSSVAEEEEELEAEDLEEELEAEESEKEISDDEESVLSEAKSSSVAEEEESEKEISDEETEEEEVVEEEVKSLEAEEEEEVFEIEIDDVTYYATSEENGILYEVDKDGEVGKKVGIIKDGEPIFS
jgi:hypothetical protein